MVKFKEWYEEEIEEVEVKEQDSEGLIRNYWKKHERRTYYCSVNFVI